MATFSRSVTVDWSGPIMEGKGIAKATTGAFNLPVTFPSRIGEPHGTTSPEELMAASHASCFAMALNGTLGRRGGSAARTVVTATIGADKGETGITIKSSTLKIDAEGLQGMDEAGFREAVKVADQGCPISNALRAALTIEHDITVK